MSRTLPARFWFEVITGSVGLALFILTLFSREWIEELTGWDPDNGSGALEIALAAGLLAISAASFFLARRDYRRVVPA
jgi:hypothetical protein